MVHFAAKIAKKCENLILEVWVQPRFPLAIFMLENPRNGRFRSVSDQEKKRDLFFCLTAAKSSMEVDDRSPEKRNGDIPGSSDSPGLGLLEIRSKICVGRASFYYYWM